MRRSSIAVPAVCFVASLLHANASAEFPAASPEATLEAVVVTASRTAQKISEALPATTVISRAEIEDSQAPDLVSLLRRQAGIELAQTGGLGSQASLFVRGANSNQVLVLVDGLRVNAVGTGAASLQHLMLDQIDHVEIVRGNVSSLYGSEAIGGVIQIFTRAGSARLDRTGAGIDAQFGGDRTRALSANGWSAFGPADARTRVGIATSVRSARGFSAIDANRAVNANPDDDGYLNRSLSATLAQQFGTHEIGVRVFQSHGRLDFDDPTDYRFIDPNYNGRIQTHVERSRQTDASVYGKLKPASFWNTDLQYGEARDKSANTSSFPGSFVIGTSESATKQITFNNIFTVVPGHVLTAGYEHLAQTGFSSSFGANGEGETFSRKVDSVMAGYTGALFLPVDANQFQFNARRDRYSDFGSATTGLAAYGYRFAPRWKAIAEASTAFKAPSFNELFFPFFGNPNLKPERARSIELGLQYAEGATTMRAALFRTRTRDLIVFDPALLSANNIARARATGLELSAQTVLDGWSLSGNLTLQRPVDEATGQRLLRRANRNFSVGVAKSFGRWRWSVDMQTAGPRFDSDINTFSRIELAGYAVTNLGLRYQIERATSVGVALSNAFDKRYALVDGFNTPGRVATVSVATRF